MCQENVTAVSWSGHPILIQGTKHTKHALKHSAHLHELVCIYLFFLCTVS